tara:strand:- start:653 stop:1402 length:750 start_codon:yes stop_codon:yes gene_type:complete
MIKLVVCRHGESVWNLENKFTGWTDVGLTEKGINEAMGCGKTLIEREFDFDIAYTSVLKRANKTLYYCLEKMNLSNLKIIKDWRLNERHYGELQGLNKLDTVKKFGYDQVQEWRRSFFKPPPKLSINSNTHPSKDKKYTNINKSLLPSSESLKDVVYRVLPLWNDVISNDLKNNLKVLIVAHGNSLRALYKIIFNVSDNKIVDFNIPTGIPMVIEFNDNLDALNSFYLGDEKEISKKIDKVKNQTKNHK